MNFDYVLVYCLCCYIETTHDGSMTIVLYTMCVTFLIVVTKSMREEEFLVAHCWRDYNLSKQERHVS